MSVNTSQSSTPFDGPVQPLERGTDGRLPVSRLTSAPAPTSYLPLTRASALTRNSHLAMDHHQARLRGVMLPCPLVRVDVDSREEVQLGGGRSGGPVVGRQPQSQAESSFPVDRGIADLLEVRGGLEGVRVGQVRERSARVAVRSSSRLCTQ